MEKWLQKHTGFKNTIVVLSAILSTISALITIGWAIKNDNLPLLLFSSVFLFSFISLLVFSFTLYNHNMTLQKDSVLLHSEVDQKDNQIKKLKDDIEQQYTQIEMLKNELAEEIQRVKRKAKKIAEAWHWFAHEQRKPILELFKKIDNLPLPLQDTPLADIFKQASKKRSHKELFDLLNKYCDILAEIFSIRYEEDNLKFCVTVKLFKNDMDLINVARNKYGYRQTWNSKLREHHTHSSIGQNGDSDFIILLKQIGSVKVADNNYERVWATDNLDEYLIEHTMNSENAGTFFNASMVVPLRKTYNKDDFVDKNIKLPGVVFPEFAGFVCVDTKLNPQQYKKLKSVFGSYKKPNECFAFCMRAMADTLFCILKNGLPYPPQEIMDTINQGKPHFIDQEICKLANELHQEMTDYIDQIDPAEYIEMNDDNPPETKRVITTVGTPLKSSLLKKNQIKSSERSSRGSDY